MALQGCSAPGKKSPGKTTSAGKITSTGKYPSANNVYYDIERKQWRTVDGNKCSDCGSNAPAIMDDDFYFDPTINKWRQSSVKGEACHTCTPKNGFPIPPK